MNRPIIPAENPDLIAFVEKNRRRFLTKWLFSTALTTILAAACFGLATRAYGLLVAILLALTLILLPFLLCGGIEWVTDKGFTGTVTRMDFSVRLEMHGNTGNITVKNTAGHKRLVRSGAGQANYCRITLRTDEEDFKTLTLRLPGDSEAFPLKEGDRIVKYRGLPYPAILGCKTPLCPICGFMDADGKGTCRACDSSLIVLSEDPSLYD